MQTIYVSNHGDDKDDWLDDRNARSHLAAGLGVCNNEIDLMGDDAT